MSVNSNNQGRAYEYACISVFYQEISRIRPVEIIYNSSYFAAKHAWEQVNDILKRNLIKSAEAVVSVVFDLEPMILEVDEYKLQLRLQVDCEGELGDVRDLVIARNNVYWEIGLSLKHNHFAVKHSRLAKKLDFGKKWFDHPCSIDYWNTIYSIFEYLETEKRNKTEWKNLPDKEEGVYVPLLQAFMDEIIRSSIENPDIPRKMVEYLLGEYDFYKVISVDARRLTKIQPFNFRGDLNKPSAKYKPKILVPQSQLPTRLVNVEMKPGSTNTVEMFLDNGWQFSFRIHSAATLVETSLKFDIQLIGMPTSIMTINCVWK